MRRQANAGLHVNQGEELTDDHHLEQWWQG
jgi:hypothetical protein